MNDLKYFKKRGSLRESGMPGGINDVMLFWGIFYPPPPPPHVMLFYASFNIVGHADPNPPSPPPA